jgi:hypothetical protein
MFMRQCPSHGAANLAAAPPIKMPGLTLVPPIELKGRERRTAVLRILRRRPACEAKKF